MEKGEEKRILQGCFPVEVNHGCALIQYDSYTNATYEENEDWYYFQDETRLVSFEDWLKMKF